MEQDFEESVVLMLPVYHFDAENVDQISVAVYVDVYVTEVICVLYATVYNKISIKSLVEKFNFLLQFISTLFTYFLLSSSIIQPLSASMVSLT